MRMMIFILLFSVAGSLCNAQAKEEDRLREVFTKFQEGINQGKKERAKELATEEFSPSFVPFYNMLVDVYSQAKIDFPIAIDHLKILSDGRAKVETYLNPGRDLIVFTLKKEGNEWKICHSEGILLPIYSVPPVPYQEIYQLADAKRGWMMAERDLAFKSLVFNKLKSAIGEQGAKDFFLDGPGYKTAMDAWLPFIEGAAQFSLFYTIVEKNYYGAHYLITKAGSEEAEIRCEPLLELDILKKASFSPKFTIEEYKELFKAIMKQRAQLSGLSIDILFNDISCIINLKRISEKQ